MESKKSMNIEEFEDIIAWKKGKQFILAVYKEFKLLKDFSFKDQIQRASVSIMNNVAEGFERKSNKELKYFLFVAKGSCGEVRSMLNLAVELEYLPKDVFQTMYNESVEISKMISGFIKTL